MTVDRAGVDGEATIMICLPGSLVISWSGFVIWLSQFRSLDNDNQAALLKLLQAREVLFQHLINCVVSSQSYLHPGRIWEGRERARCFLYLLYLYGRSSLTHSLTVPRMHVEDDGDTECDQKLDLSSKFAIRWSLFCRKQRILSSFEL